SGFNSVIATYGSFRIGVDAEKYMYQPGESIKLTITAKDYDGNPIQTPFHATIGRWKYREGMQDIESRDGTTGKDGTGVVELTAREAGSLTVKITAKTPEGREIEDRTWVWIPGAGDTTWKESKQVKIIPDKKSYKVGDTAHLMVMTNVPQAQVLVTTEGRTI